MTFRVVWPDAASNQLVDALTEAGRAGDRTALNAALARVESALARDPIEAGESRSGAGRVLVDQPLVIEFEVFPDEQVVVVTAARYRPARRA